MSYVIGIDLGTTNSALAYIDTSAATDPLRTAAGRTVRDRATGQSRRSARRAPAALVPLPAGPERLPRRLAGLALGRDGSPGSRHAGPQARRGERRPAGVLGQVLALPLGRRPHRRPSSLQPLRKASARSRRSRPRARYLEHLRDAWNQAHPDAPFEQQQILVTVPASFDAVARELTEHAAQEAGYKNVILLEEPQAAFYAWIERHPDWREQVQVGDLILVVDIGGGTTDFTLIAVTEEDGDCASSAWRSASTSCSAATTWTSRWPTPSTSSLTEKGTKLDTLQFNALWQQCRVAKEKLLESDEEEGASGHHPRPRHGTGRRHDQELRSAAPISTASCSTASSRRSRARTCRRAAAARACRRSACPTPPTRRSPGTWRSSCASRRQASTAVRGPAAWLPTHVLFNGGVLRAGLVRDRLVSVLELLARGRRHAAGQGAGGRGPDARRRARRRLLRPGARAARACASAAACRAPTMSASRAPCPPCPACPPR